jgi:hypothetical protein
MKKLWAIVAMLVLAVSAYAAWQFLVTPKYGWLVFGPEGKVRMLLRADGDAASIDLNRNGRFDAAEHLKASPTRSIPVSDGKTSYVISGIGHYANGGSRNVTVTVDVKGPPEFRQLGDLSLSRSRASAPIAHFNGPLKIEPQTLYWELPPDLALRRGDKGTDMRVNIGTIRKADRCWTMVYTQDRTNAFFPTNVFPWVDVEFPSMKGGSPILVRYPLDKVC